MIIWLYIFTIFAEIFNHDWLILLSFSSSTSVSLPFVSGGIGEDVAGIFENHEEVGMGYI